MKLNGTTRGLTLALTATLAVSTAPILFSSASAATPKLSLVGTSDDGSAFDLDEYDADDVTVQLTGSAGAVDADDAQDLLYHWTITPFDATTPGLRFPTTGEDVQATDVAGEFAVPLPTGQPSGTYYLVAALGPNATGTGAIAAHRMLTLKVGQASVELADDAPLRVVAGASAPVAGTLALEDGTGLPGRLIDLTVTRGTAGTDPLADAGFVPVPAGAPTTTTQVTTDADGAFTAELVDPAEDGQGTELGGSVQAETATTPDVGDADASASRDVDVVSEQPPADSALVVGTLGDSRPGTSLATQARATAPDDTFDRNPVLPGVQGDLDTDRDPIEGQVYGLAVDHGFFTTGDEELPSVAGDAAGNLVDLGTTHTGLTDADGRVDLQVGIERDAAFDDDGLVTATVTATAGDLTADGAAHWNTANPLNGKVDISLSPAAEQDAAVDPTLAGDRTYYEVFTRDQFGNPVKGESVDLTYAGDLDDFDYSHDSVVSDLDSSGDIWVVSFEAGSIDVTGTWNTPAYTYDDTTGGASTKASSDVEGTTTASFYEADFTKSTFSIRSTAKDVVEVGNTVSQTVRVIDQEGNPVRGYRVQFFRYGPRGTGGGPAVRTTNSRGEATYTFIGNQLGTARTTATVSDGVRSRTLTNTVVFGAPVRSVLTAASGSGSSYDVVSVKAPSAASGARVTLYRVVRGELRAVSVRTLDTSGRSTFKVKDPNARGTTTYVANVRSTPRTVADRSNTVQTK
jgi:hypothetical protein